MNGGSLSSSKSQIIPELKMFSELSKTDGKKIIATLNGIKSGTDQSYSSMDEYLTWLDGKGKGYVANYVKENQNQIYTTDGVIAASKAARAEQIAHNLTIKQSTIAYKAATLAKRAFATVANIAIMFGISQAVKLVYDMAVANEKLLETSRELTAEFKNAESSITDYKIKISELYSTINDSSSSIADTTKARQDLMVIQDELIQKFGTEKDTIEIITSAINDQSSALDELSKKQYLQWKNEFNDKTFAQSSGDFFTSDNIGNAFHKLTEFDFAGAFDMLTQPTEDNISKMINSMELSYYKLEKTGNETLDNLIKKSYGLTESFDGKFVLSGNLNEIKDDLISIQEMSSDFEVSDRFEADLTRVSNAMDKNLTAYKDAYNTYVLYEKVLNASSDNQYDEQFNAINKAKEAYDNAFKSGDQSSIKSASENFAIVLSSAMDLAMSHYDEDVANYFANMYPELQQQVGEWKFDVNFAPNTDGLKDKVQNAIPKLDGYSTEDIINFNPHVASKEQQDAYADLNNVALEYGLTLDQLIAKLEKEKLVTSEASQELQKRYGNKVNELSDEDYIVATKVSDGSIKSWDELIAKIKEYKIEQENLNESPILSTSDIIGKMDSEMKPAFESIKSAYEDIFTFNDKGKEVFTLENVDLSMLSSIKSSLDSVSEDLKINIDYSSFEDLSKILVDSSSTADDVRDAFDALSSTVLSSLSSSISECTDENAELVQSMLESIGITNAQELVSEALEGRYLDEAAAKSILANASLDLETVTISEISALEQEGTIAPLVATRLYELAFAKQMSNSENMDTSGEVANLLALAENCGYTGEAVTYLTELEQIYQQVASGTLSPEMLDAKLSRASELQELIKSASANISYKPNVEFNPNFNNKKAKDAASKAGKDAADAYKESLEKEVQKYETALSGITGLLSKQISAYGKQKEAAVDSLNAQKEAAEEAYEAQKKAIDEQIKGIETQINALEKQKKSRQDEIDKIRDANNERDLQLDLEKKIHEYNQMLNQRSRVYTEKKGVIYTQNTSGVLDAKNAVDDARDEIKISGIEKDIKSIENSIDSLNDKIDGFEDQKNKIDELIESSNNYYESLIKQTESYWDSLIDGLTNYKSRWEELGDIQENAKLIATLKEFGMTTEDILSMSDSAFASFKDGYLNSLNNLYAGNDSMLSAISEAAGNTANDLGTYSEATKSYLDTLAKTDLSGVATDLSTTADGMDRVASSSQTASTNTQSTAESMTALNESTTGISDNLTAISEGLDKIASTTGLETMNESLAELLNMIAELSETSLNEGIITQFANLKTAIESVTASIGGGSTGGSSGGEDGEGVSGLTGAMQEHGNISAEILGGSGEDNEGLGEIGQFGQLKEAVDNVSASIGSGEESEKSGSEEGGSLTSSLQSHFEVASEVVPQEQELFQNLTDVMGQAKEYIESIKTTLEDMDGKEFSVTLNISGGGINGMTFTTDESSEKKGDNVEVFASGGVVTASNPYFDAFANKHGEDTMVAVRKGERILTPVQNDYWERWTKAIPNLLEGYNTLVDVKKPDYSNIATTKLQEVTVHQDINVTIPNLDGEAAFHKFERGLDQMKNDAIQRSYKR